MTRRTTIKDIAELAGVSLGSVHCALAGKTGVGETTRRRILDIAKQNNYRPNIVAASLKRKTLRIAAAFPEAVEDNRFYFPQVWKGVRDCLHSRRDFNIELLELPYRKGEGRQEEELERLHAEGGIDGLLTLGFSDDFGSVSLTRFNRLNIPMVLVGDDVPQSGRLCCVQPNYQVVGRMLAELVVRQIPAGASILICAGNASMPSHYLALMGFDDYLRERGLENTVYKIHTGAFGRDGAAVIVRELEKHPDVVACVSVTARCSFMLGLALIELARVGNMIAVGSDLFDENIAFLADGVFTNILNKNQYYQSHLAASILVEYLLRDVAPANDVMFVGSEVVFQSALPMLEAGYPTVPCSAFKNAYSLF